MFHKLISGPSGTALVGLFLLFAVASEAIVRFGRRRHALIYAGGAGVMALLGLDAHDHSRPARRRRCHPRRRPLHDLRRRRPGRRRTLAAESRWSISAWPCWRPRRFGPSGRMPAGTRSNRSGAPCSPPRPWSWSALPPFLRRLGKGDVPICAKHPPGRSGGHRPKVRRASPFSPLSSRPLAEHGGSHRVDRAAAERLGGLARSPGDRPGTFAGTAGRHGVHRRFLLAPGLATPSAGGNLGRLAGRDGRAGSRRGVELSRRRRAAVAAGAVDAFHAGRGRLAAAERMEHSPLPSEKASPAKSAAC